MEIITPQPGDTIAGRFELISKVGAGAFGAVFKARQLGIDRQVAIKLLMPDADTVDSTAVARFKREAKLSSSLEHPNTITIHDYGEWQGVLYLAMEYVRGQSLRQMIKKEGRMSPERSVHITLQILASLGEAHSRGIIHRDMKPANIMLFDRFSEKDVVKVLDFGIAKFVSNDGASMSPENAQEDLTVAGRIVGTPRYMAPEQVKGLAASPSSDLYGLGLILYEMVAGRKAVTGDSTMSLIAMQLSPQPAIQADDRLVPSGLMPVILKATHKDPNERYQSSKEFAEALSKADLTREEIPIPSIGPAISGVVELEDDDLEEVTRPWGLIIASLAVAAVMMACLLAAILYLGSERKTDPLPVVEKVEKEVKNVEPPVEKVEEKVEKAPEKAVEAPKDAKVELTINTTPAGAAIMNGDESLGLAPLTVELDPEKASALRVVKRGFEDAEILVAADMDPNVSVTLKRLRPKNPTVRPPKGGPKAAPKADKKPNDYKPF
jgi:serine/threonine protein kinase